MDLAISQFDPFVGYFCVLVRNNLHDPACFHVAGSSLPTIQERKGSGVMSPTIIVQILLAVLTVMVGLGAFIGANRANASQAAGAKSAIDAAAYERAKQIYESAIDTLQEQIQALREQMMSLDQEVIKLQQTNQSLVLRVAELQVTNHDLTEQISELRKKKI